MACDLTITGRSLPCRDALGGVRKVWICTAAQGTDHWDAIDATGEVPDTSAAATYNDFLSPKNTSSFTQTINASMENGTVYYTQVLSLVLNKIEASDITMMENLGKGRLSIVVQDNNLNYFVMGHARGCLMTGGTIATGAAMGDLNGFTLEFTAEEVDAAPFLPVAASGLPNTTNATFS